jgi:hypothetical protein
LQDLRKTVQASPVYALEGAYDFYSKEYDYADFIRRVVRVQTKVHDPLVSHVITMVMTAGDMVQALLLLAMSGPAGTWRSLLCVRLSVLFRSAALACQCFVCCCAHGAHVP